MYLNTPHHPWVILFIHGQNKREGEGEGGRGRERVKVGEWEGESGGERVGGRG